MKKIVYITTSYRDCGPTQQLLNIISGLDKKNFEPILISLTDPVEGDRFDSFKKLSIKNYNMGINKASAILSLARLKKLLLLIKPHLVHSHGLLPDLLMMLSSSKTAHVLTIRNDPFLDYPTKFGMIIGNIMAVIHILAIRSCSTAIACSESLQHTFLKYDVNAKVVRNGVDPSFIETNNLEKSPTSKIPTFITAGSLIPRKNIELMISVMASDTLKERTNFLVLGDGFLMPKCKELASKNVSLLGHIDKPYSFLASSEYYISLSKSEGMPNSVIEALMVGLPCVLSNIKPHQEIYDLMPDYIHLVNCSKDVKTIASDISSWLESIKVFDNHEIRLQAIEKFHAKATSFQYQKIYLDKIGKENV